MMTNVQLLRSLLTSPRRFFAQLADHPRFALPMWLSLAVTCGLLAWYYAVVDPAWLIDQTLAASTAQMTEAQREQAARFMTTGALMAGSVVGAIALSFVMRLLEALWYRVAGRVTGVARSYRQWFAMGWWTGLPHVLGAIPAALVLLLAENRQIDAGVIQPLSFNELFFHFPMGSPGYNLMSGFGLLHLFTLGLTIFGVRCWSGRSWAYSAILVLLPVVLIVGPWAWIVLGRSP